MKMFFFPATNEADVWNVYTQSWTGRTSAARPGVPSPSRERVKAEFARWTRGHES